MTNKYFEEMANAYEEWEKNGKQGDAPMTKGQIDAYRTVMYSTDEIIECDDLPWEKDMQDFVEALRNGGIKEIVVTDHSTALMNGIHALVENGCTMDGLYEKKEDETRHGYRRQETKKGIKFSIN